MGSNPTLSAISDRKIVAVASHRTPFDSIEGALEYVGLLREAIVVAKQAVEQEKARAGSAAVRRLEALQLISYKLDRLGWHMDGSRRLLKDLRMLRRLLLGERRGLAEPGDASKEVSPKP
ncbi:MAG: hypothetical protein ACREUS_10510 [Burkholderiales bacterium]